MTGCLMIAWLAATLAQDTNVMRPSSAGQPTESSAALAIQSSLKAHVIHLAKTVGERNLGRYEQLNQAADYVDAEFKKYGYEPKRQTFQVKGLDCHNIIGEIKGTKVPDQIVIVDADYDSVRGTPGANDNGSGTAAMLVLAQRFTKVNPDRTLRFVAFTNEEPPYFQTEDEMGSWVYAKQCRQKNEDIVAVISLETMGYFTDQPNSQKYPPPLDQFYPSTGNFIGFIGNLQSAMLQRAALKSFKAHCDVPCEGVSLPDAMQGVGWSDHWSFWQEGYVGIMVTDTAPFRYPHYHRRTDTPDKINFPVFAKVVEGLQKPIQLLTREDSLNRRTKRKTSSSDQQR